MSDQRFLVFLGLLDNLASEAVFFGGAGAVTGGGEGGGTSFFSATQTEHLCALTYYLFNEAQLKVYTVSYLHDTVTTFGLQAGLILQSFLQVFNRL